jgi:nucleoid DNA-binding protein
MKKEKGGRALLIEALVAKGFSVRKARKAVNGVIAVMISGLRRGETVDIPGGTIQKAWRKGKGRQRLTTFRNAQTKKIDHALVGFFRQHVRVKFTPDPTLDVSPLPVPPPPPTPQQLEERQLASELAGRPATDRDMQSLQKAASIHPTRPADACLLRRLRELKQRGRKYIYFDYLAYDVEWLYWV